MAELLSTITTKEEIPGLGVKTLYVRTASSADAGDTITLNLGSYGMSNVYGLTEHIIASTGSIAHPGFNTYATGVTSDDYHPSRTSVSSGVLTITVGTGTNFTHVYEILGE